MNKEQKCSICELGLCDTIEQCIKNNRYPCNIEKINILTKKIEKMQDTLNQISNKNKINECTCFYCDEDPFSDCQNCDMNKGCTYYLATC